MQSNKFLLLAITSLWLVGLYGVLFALGYLAQHRRRFRRRAQSLWDTPRIMAPLYLSSSLFCTGLAIHTYLLPPTALASTALSAVMLSPFPGQWAVIVGWALLALLLVSQALITVITGLRFGWDESVTALAYEHHWDGRRSGTLYPFFRWAATAILLWIVLFTFGSGFLDLWEMLIRRLGPR